MRKMLILALIVLAGMVSAAISVGSYTVSPTTLKPGEEGSVTFTISNVLPSSSVTTVDPLEDVSVYFSGSEGVEFKAKSPFSVGTISSGGSALVSIPIKILPTAKGGVVTASFYISAKGETGLKTVNAIITVVNPPILTMGSDKQTILSTDTLNLTITNNGGDANRVILKLTDDSNFSFIGTTQVYVGDIEGSESAAVSAQIDSRNVDEGVSSIPFVLSYQEEGGSSVNETKKLAIAVKKEKADVVFTQDGPIVTSQDNFLLLKVKNTGRALEDFEVYVEDEEIKAKESKQIKLGDFAAGEEKEISVLVFVDAEPGVRSTELTLKWVEDDVEKEESTTVPIVVNSDADAAIFIDAKPTPIISGGEHTLAILVSNVGSYKIQNVEVSLEDNDAFEIFNAQRSQYIGGLESDDFSTVQYKVRLNAIEPSSHPVTVNVRYKDQSGVWVDKKNVIYLNIMSAEAAGAGGEGDNTFLFLLIIVVAAGGYWWYRKRKEKAKK